MQPAAASLQQRLSLREQQCCRQPVAAHLPLAIRMQFKRAHRQLTASASSRCHSSPVPLESCDTHRLSPAQQPAASLHCTTSLFTGGAEQHMAGQEVLEVQIWHKQRSLPGTSKPCAQCSTCGGLGSRSSLPPLSFKGARSPECCRRLATARWASAEAGCLPFLHPGSCVWARTPLSMSGLFAAEPCSCTCSSLNR